MLRLNKVKLHGAGVLWYWKKINVKHEHTALWSDFGDALSAVLDAPGSLLACK